MSELTPTERHARLVEEIKRRLEQCRELHRNLERLLRCAGLSAQVSDRIQELAALLKVAERHCPLDDSDKCAGSCSYCAEDSADFPCVDFLSCEKILGPADGQV
jgi:hypothetical protein